MPTRGICNAGAATLPSLKHTCACPPLSLSRFDPLWNSIVVGGFHGGKPFLGTVGMIGTNYTDEHVATGTGGGLKEQCT